MNQTTVMGNLGTDPEVRFTSKEQKVTTLRVAENQKKGGVETTIWWRVTIWGEQFDRMMPYLKKGSSIIVMGQMSKPEIYTDKSGQPQVSVNITAYNLAFSPFGRKDSQEEGQQKQEATGGLKETASAGIAQGQAPAAPAEELPAFSDDDIPF